MTTTNKHLSGQPDGATAEAHVLDTTAALSTGGAKLLSIKNAGVEKFAIDKDGNVTVGGVMGPTGPTGPTGDTGPQGPTGSQISLTAGATMAYGDVCYIAPSGVASLIDAATGAKMPGLAMCVEGSLPSGDTGSFLLMGEVTYGTWGTTGAILYGSTAGTSGNTITDVAPGVTGDTVQILGIALSATTMVFSPQLVTVVLA